MGQSIGRITLCGGVEWVLNAMGRESDSAAKEKTANALVPHLLELKKRAECVSQAGTIYQGIEVSPYVQGILSAHGTRHSSAAEAAVSG